MKIAFTAQGNGWYEKVDLRFGRARGFFVVDTETEEADFIDNTVNLEAAHGAGTSAAQNVINAGIEALITGHVGPKAGSVLKNAGIKVYTTEGNITLKDAYQKFKEGKLEEQKL
ncbi:MAG: NifB/NifX family molybdenum-iron cluster-binding protein [Caldisericaceae bacterium]|nr:NifB/NifX family molybdenum-iron cluster-binding protein [Caldisericaceae bacterium]